MPQTSQQVRASYNRLRPLEAERSFARRLAPFDYAQGRLDDYPYRIVDYG
jgi:hypothetical protein